MANDYYDHTTFPAFGSQGASSTMRSEFDSIEAGFDKCIDLSSNASKVVAINAGGTAQEGLTTTGTGNVVLATDPTFTLTDVATNNASTLQHGWMKKLSGNATDFLNGLGSWTAILANTLQRSARTSNTILASGDNAFLIDITSGTFSQTFTAAATLGNGWYCFIRNAVSGGDVTLDPNASETIDGLTSFIMYPGEVRLIMCTGSTFFSVVVSPFCKTYTGSGTFVKPPGYTKFGGLAWSAGSSGERNNNAAVASKGGTAGGCFPYLLNASSVGISESITIGAGGTAITGVSVGNSGGNTSFGSLLTVFGASVGVCGGSIGTTAVINAGGTAIGSFAGQGVAVAPIQAIYGGAANASTSANDSGSSVYGGGAGAGVDGAGVVRSAGVSAFAGNGGAASIAGNGGAGTAPAGGGGATQTGTSSGAGARGQLEVWGVA